MTRQRPQCELVTKAAIRRRDGKVCAACGIDSLTHLSRYGQKLEVHRSVPGSEYSTKWGVCVTLCDFCHLVMDGHTHWGWVMKGDVFDEEELEYKLWRMEWADIDAERVWRKRLAWGMKLRTLRIEKFGEFANSVPRFVAYSGLGKRDLANLEHGRREPTLSEARIIAEVLKVSLDKLAEEPRAPETKWMEECVKQSRRRALIFCCREAEADDEAISSASRLVMGIVQRSDEAHEVARQKAAEVTRKKMLEYRALTIGKRAEIIYPSKNHRTK